MTTKPAVKLKNYYPMFIGGQFVDSQSGERMTVYNPATGEAITEVAKGKKGGCGPCCSNGPSSLRSQSLAHHTL